MSMIAAVLAQGSLTGGGYTPADPNADVYMDFVAGTYEVAQAPVAVTDLLGGGFEAGAIDGNGMAIWDSNSNRPEAATSLYDYLNAGLTDGFSAFFEMTAIAEQTGGVSGLSGTALGLYDDTLTYASSNYLVMISSTPEVDDGYSLFLSQAGYLVEPGLNRFAYTVGRDLGDGNYRVALSVNGQTAATTDLGYKQSDHLVDPVLVAFGWTSDGAYADGIYIRKIILYPPMTDAELSALTTL